LYAAEENLGIKFFADDDEEDDEEVDGTADDGHGGEVLRSELIHAKIWNGIRT
jgi:hypothetical protein